MRLISYSKILVLLLILTFDVHDVYSQDYELIWSDEFDGTSVDLDKWEFQTGDGCPLGICGWGNNELQWYQEANTTVENGILTITGDYDPNATRQYTSSRLRTKGKASWKYGRFEIRAKLPFGQGTWPAFWMLPEGDVYGGWAASGEIDIMEFVGSQPNKIHGTIHYGGAWPNNQNSGGEYTFSSGVPADDFHVYSIEWEENVMRWYVDDVLYSTKTSWNTAGHSFPAPFDQEFHLLMNFAIGGNFPGNPDATSTFPQTYEIDYIRVYQQATQTDIEEVPDKSQGSLINFPNPFEKKTTIEFSIPQQSNVKLELFDLFGRSVSVVVNDSMERGTHQKVLDAEGLAPGVYYLNLETPSFKRGEMLHLR